MRVKRGEGHRAMAAEAGPASSGLAPSVRPEKGDDWRPSGHAPHVRPDGSEEWASGFRVLPHRLRESPEAAEGCFLAVHAADDCSVEAEESVLPSDPAHPSARGRSAVAPGGCGEHQALCRPRAGTAACGAS